LRVIDCECGTTIKAANDDELEAQVRAHVAEDHPGTEMSDEEIRGLIERRAYEASDA
jgi:predicted small metal-binding protein